jgi:hypothetical protein
VLKGKSCSNGSGFRFSPYLVRSSPFKHAVTPFIFSIRARAIGPALASDQNIDEGLERAGWTSRYTTFGPEDLLKAKTVIVIASRCRTNTKAMGLLRFWALARAAWEYPGEMRLVQETGGANAIGASESSVDNISPAPMKV